MSQPVYLIAQIEVKDRQQYLDQYGAPLAAQLAELGAELLVTSPDREIREGVWAGNWTVVIRFPSRAVATAWYESAEYAPLKDARINTLTTGGNLVFVPGRDPAIAR